MTILRFYRSSCAIKQYLKLNLFCHHSLHINKYANLHYVSTKSQLTTTILQHAHGTRTTIALNLAHNLHFLPELASVRTLWCTSWVQEAISTYNRADFLVTSCSIRALSVRSPRWISITVASVTRSISCIVIVVRVWWPVVTRRPRGRSEYILEKYWSG